METNQSKFKTGDIVILKVDSSRQGPIIEILTPVHGQYRYKIFHSPMDVKEYLEDQIVLFVGKEIETKSLNPELFLVRLNSFRLRYPQNDSLYALHAARIKFIPFQFKPLLRFLRAEQPRLLIADEVGVGKTIEAGIILRELQSRQNLKNILIMCPKALVLKWQTEMKRFDEDFRPLNSDALRYCLRETHQDGIWPNQYSRSIVHIELLRREEYLYGTQEKKARPGIFTLNPPPQFDLLIVDEAHHLRTPDNNTNELAKFLCSISEAVIFLTATPMQLGSKNLFTLLNLLRPDQFIDEILFEEMITPNKFLNQTIRHIRTKRPVDTWQNDALNELDNAIQTVWGRSVLVHDPRCEEWLRRLKEKNGFSDNERIKFIRDLEDIHTLAHIMNRTRRRDIGRFTVREPFTINVPFTIEQQHFFDALISYRRELLLLHYEPNLIKLITDMLERQAASCLPGIISLLDKFIETEEYFSISSTDDPDEDYQIEIPESLHEKARELKRMAEVMPDEDPKFEHLLHIISDTISNKGPGKILVFSFFLHTLAYLEKKLKQRGYRVEVVNGLVDDEDRENLRELFRLDRREVKSIDILLSSEVGCEGLDYEFCSRLVNYDIPWNPMRIEQRIGRIDRFGQQSEKVQIYNFITPGTVEERIFYRCFERLGIFKDTIGDIEEVLGNLTESLTQVVLDSTLTPRQAEEKALQLADNTLRMIEEQRRLEEESSELLGLDRLYQDEVEQMQRDERFVSSEEIKQIIKLYFEVRCKNVKISSETNQKMLVKIRANKEDRDTILEDIKKIKRQDRQTIEIIRWLEGNDPFITVTFDQETALELRKIPFITPIHPLTKVAISFWNEQKEPLFTQITIKDSTLQSGIYVFAYYIWETVSIRPEIRLIPLVWDLRENKLSDALTEKFQKIMKQAGILKSDMIIQSEELNRSLQSLEESIYSMRSIENEKLIATNLKLAEQQIASIDRYYQRRMLKIYEDLSIITDERIKRMKESERERIQREWEHKKKQIEDKQKADIIIQRIAYGIMEVK